MTDIKFSGFINSQTEGAYNKFLKGMHLNRLIMSFPLPSLDNTWFYEYAEEIAPSIQDFVQESLGLSRLSDRVDYYTYKEFPPPYISFEDRYEPTHEIYKINWLELAERVMDDYEVLLRANAEEKLVVTQH